MNNQTKRLIANNYVLLAKKNGKVSVTDLVVECHISRQTFYYHFKDLNEVLEWLVNAILKDIVEKTSKATTLYDAIYLFFKSCYEIQPELQLALNSTRRHFLQKTLHENLTSFLKKMLAGDILEETILARVDSNTKELLFLFYSYGIMGFIFDGQINSEEDVKRITKHVYMLMTQSQVNFN